MRWCGDQVLGGERNEVASTSEIQDWGQQM